MPGEQALQTRVHEQDDLLSALHIAANKTPAFSATIRVAADRIRILASEIDAALAAGGGDQESAQSLPSWRIGAPASTWRPMDADALRPSSVLLAVQTDAGRLVGEAHHVVNEDNGRGEWWWAQEGPGDYHAEPIGWPILAWQPLPEPPAPVMAALGAATKAGSGSAPNPSPHPTEGEEREEPEVVIAARAIVADPAMHADVIVLHAKAYIHGYEAGLSARRGGEDTRTAPSPDPILGDDDMSVLRQIQVKLGFVARAFEGDKQTRDTLIPGIKRIIERLQAGGGR